MRNIIVALGLLLLSSCGLDNLKQVRIPDTGTFLASDYIAQQQYNKTNGTTASSMRGAPDKNLFTDKKVHQYLQRILKNIIKQWPGEADTKVDIMVTVDAFYGAYSSPDTIIVSMGTLNDAESEDEVAFLLAHEFAHVALNHHATGRYQEKLEATVAQAADVGIVASKLAEVSYSNKTLSIDASKDKLKYGQRGLLTGMAVNRLSRDVVNSSTRRGEEGEADILAIDLMTKAGYNPSAAITALERIKSARIFTEQQLKEKTAEYNAFIDEVSKEGGSIAKTEVGQIGYLAVNETFSQLLQNSANRHPEEDARMRAIIDYVKREHRKSRYTKLKKDVYTVFINNSMPFKHYQLAQKSIMLIENNEIDAAEKLARQSIGQPTQSDLYTRYAFSLVRRAQLDNRKSQLNLDHIDDWSSASVQMYLLASQVYRQSRLFAKSQFVIEQGINSIGSIDPFYPEMIALNFQQNRQKQAEVYLAECIKIDAENIIAQCYHQAGYKIPEKKTDTQGTVVDEVNELLSIFN